MDHEAVPYLDVPSGCQPILVLRTYLYTRVYDGDSPLLLSPPRLGALFPARSVPRFSSDVENYDVELRRATALPPTRNRICALATAREKYDDSIHSTRLLSGHLILSLSLFGFESSLIIKLTATKEYFH